ncbi:MAG: MDR family oxidoreductase [Alphaproteobacteria bacterium]
MSDNFEAIVITKTDDGQTVARETLPVSDLTDGDVLVKVEWSTVNYKDGLAVSGAAPIARKSPMIAGIDLAGEVVESADDRFKPGDKVLANGYGMSETRWGGYATMARVPAEPVIKLPEGISARQAMAVGTAGYTAMLCVLALEDHGVTPQSGPILVTGAAGGVGSVAIALLAKLGYTIIASTGRVEEADYLKSLGASEIIDRSELSGDGRPLGKERWAGVVDSVGSKTLANAIASTNYGGTVAACGLAQGGDLPSSVMPFILRGVTLAGVDSVMAPREKRERAWARLATDLEMNKLDAMINEVSFDDVLEAAPTILQGTVRGRLVVNIGG